VLLEELGPLLRAKRVSHGAVDAMLESPIAPLLAARTFTHLTFPAVDRALAPGESLVEAIADAVTSPRARHVFSTFTRGQVRYRISWKSGGHRRAAVFDVAARVAAIEPSYVNDPRSSTWEVCVDDARGRIAIDLHPRALVDARFAYRVTDVPAASHPTLAAAIAFLGGVRSDDVVWDPFVGSGLELIERARLGPCASLLGTDISAVALSAARDNLQQAGVVAALEQLDARKSEAAGVTLIVTNPPMGRRVTSAAALTDLLVPFVAHAAEALAPGGRMVWITPQPRDTNRAAARAGLVIERAYDVDMGGFSAVLQRLVKP
jgi:23S rRNA G2445 N2-methylase RlmL